MSFYSELRQRRIVQIVATYAAAGWLILEGSASLIEMEVLPPLVYRVLLVWYVGGLFAALVLGWYHGEKGRQNVSPTEVVFLSGIGLSVLIVSGSTIAGEVGGAPVGGGDLDLHNVAVLYFDDFSRDSADAYLADALTEGVIRELRTVGTLNVVTATGVRRFRGSDAPYDSIASVLGAGILVDGSVEVSRGRARVNVRLVDGSSGAEIGRIAIDPRVEESRTAAGTIATEVALRLRELLGEELRLQEISSGTEEFRAWQLFQQARRMVKDGRSHMEGGNPDAADLAYRTADSLLAVAEDVDPQWPEPSAYRGEIALALSQRVHDPDERYAWAERGLEHVERALAADPNHPGALEMRGTLHLWKYLGRLTRTPGERETVIERAQEDLELATRLDPDRASAWRTLGLVYARFDNVRSATAVARAYEADAYLEDAEGILHFLFMTNFSNLGQFSQARRWCDEGVRRFPEDHRFTTCRLQLMTIPGARPGEDDLAEAERLLSRLDARVPEGQRAEQLVQGRMIFGTILARASGAATDPARRALLADSARTVLDDARARLVAGELSPALLSPAAYGWLVLGEQDRAIDLLKMYVAAEHGFSADGDINWKWIELRSHPRFQELVTRRGEDHH